MTAEIKNPVHSNEKWKISDESIVNTNTFDSQGNTLTSTDGMGNVIKYEYDNLSRIEKVILPDSGQGENITQYMYDIYESDGITSDKTIDANGHTSKEYKDSDGNTVRISDDGDGKVTSITTSYQHDDKGNVTRQTYTDGSSKKYEYDGKNRLISVTFYKNDGTGAMRKKYSYSSSDKILTEEDLILSEDSEKRYCYYIYEYNELDELISSCEYRGDSQEPVNQLRYTYDEAGRKIGVQYLHPQNHVKALKYNYNENGWLVSVLAVSDTNKENTLRTYSYTPLGKVSEIRDYRSFGGEESDTAYFISKQYSYDSFDRVSSITYIDSKEPETTLEKYEYTYDKNSNILTEVIQKNYSGTYGTSLHEIRTHIYDTLGRLISTEEWDKVKNTKKTITYSYDKVGNRISQTEDGTTTLYDYNSLNQLVSEQRKHSSQLIKDISYTYDLNGNVKEEVEKCNNKKKKFTYDSENRLETAEIIENNRVVLTQSNKYNCDGVRLQKEENGEITNYYYQDGSVLFTTDKENTVTSFNLLGLDSNIISSSRSDGKFYYYNKDIKGSSTSILDCNGDLVVSYNYSDFGETTRQGDDSFVNEVCYTGGIYDESTGLYYLNARYYNPLIGRFLSQDTYRGETTDADSWHLYAYCANNPINRLDPSGHVIETVLDIASIGWSVLELVTKPSWMAVGNLAWDVAATCVPFLPGSYTAKGLTKAKKAFKGAYGAGKGLKHLKYAGRQTEICLKIASRARDLARGSKLLTVGKYKELRKLFRGVKGVEVHHIIEKRFKFLDIPEMDYPAIPITRELHRKITKEWRRVIPYRNSRKAPLVITKEKMKLYCKDVYRDMPALYDIAIRVIDQYGVGSVGYATKRR